MMSESEKEEDGKNDILPKGVLGRFLFRREGVRALRGLDDAPSRTEP